MALAIDQLDDQLVADFCENFSGGMDGYQPPHALEQNQAASMQNLDLSTSLLAQTRPGTRINGTTRGAAVRALEFFNTGPGLVQHLVALANSHGYYWDNSTWATMGGYSPATTNPCAMAQALNKLYMADGVGNMFSWDGTTATDMLNTNVNPPRGSMVMWISNRMLVSGVGANQDRIWYSNSGDPATWDRGANYISIGEGDGQSVKAWCKWDNFNFVVCRESSTFLVNADPTVTPPNWVRSRLSTSIGCPAPKTMCQVGKDVWWLSDHGVTNLSRIYVDSQTKVSPSVSEPVRPILDRMNLAAIGKANACFWNNRYFLSIPVDAATECNYLLVYNTNVSQWTGFWTNINANAFAKQSFAGSNRLAFGDATGGVKVLQDRPTDQIFDDDGAAIGTELITRGFIWNDRTAEKVPANVHPIFYKSTATVTIEAILDQAKRKIITTSLNSGSGGPVLPVVLPFSLGFQGNVQKIYGVRTGPAFMVQYSVRTSSGYVALRSVISNAYMNAQRIAKLN